MAERTTIYMPLDEIVAADRNPKRHDDGEIDTPLLDERTGKLVGGHGRLDGLRRRRDAGKSIPEDCKLADDGTWLVPVQRGWSSRDDKHAEAMGIALNRIGERGGWYDEALATMLSDIRDDSSLDGIGFSSTDLDEMLAAIDASFGQGNIADAQTPHDRLASYLDSAIRSLILPFPTNEYDEVVELLDRVQRASASSSHSEAVLNCLRMAAAASTDA
jgi:hypothetical protein